MTASPSPAASSLGWVPSTGSTGRVPAPAYFRPVISGGKAFPVVRSNFLSLLEFPDNWHAPRLRLIGGTWELVGVHEGIDIASETGTPVVAMAPGAVENVGWTFYSGNRVGVRGSDGRYYFYAHLSSIAVGLGVGSRVEAGTLIGQVGNTGYGPPGERDQFPPHLHFGIQVGSGWVNPYPTLVALYTATVRADLHWQDQLDRLALAHRDARWDALATRTFTNFGLTP